MTKLSSTFLSTRKAFEECVVVELVWQGEVLQAVIIVTQVILGIN